MNKQSNKAVILTLLALLCASASAIRAETTNAPGGASNSPSSIAAATALPLPTVTGGPDYPGGAGSPPPSVVDGNPATYWAGDPAVNDWELNFDFGSPVMLPAVNVLYYSGRYQAKETKVLLSDDGQKWDSVGTLPVADSAQLPLGRTARYLKLKMSGRVQDKQPAIKDVTFPALSAGTTPAATPADRAPEATNAGTAAVLGWPSGVQKIEYPSSADSSLQPALFYQPAADKPVPLLVALHTWSGNYQQTDSEPAYASWCMQHGWAMIHPNFRGPNSTPQACGSEFAVQDILSSVDYAVAHATIDPDRIYLVGVSGGGHMALLMAGRAPKRWAAVSAWCGISDLAAWYQQTKTAGHAYWKSLEAVCGGAPGSSALADDEYRKRSPLTWLKAAADLPLDINTGIEDGFKGSVPVSQSLEAYNAVVPADTRIDEAEIRKLASSPVIASELKQVINAPSYGPNPALYRKLSKNTRITIFQGAHQINQFAALEWLSRQVKGHPVDFSATQVSNPTQGASDSGK